MEQQQITFLISISGIIASIILFIWRLSNKYSLIEQHLISIQSDVSLHNKKIEDNCSLLNAHENKINVININMTNMSNVMVLKSDLARLETEMLYLKNTIEDIKSTLRESIKLNTTQYQELSQKLGTISSQYGEIKDYLKK